MAFRKTTFELNGMNEYIFPLTFNDVHLSLKHENDLQNVCITNIQAIHKGGAKGIQYQLMPLSK